MTLLQDTCGRRRFLRTRTTGTDSGHYRKTRAHSTGSLQACSAASKQTRAHSRLLPCNRRAARSTRSRRWAGLPEAPPSQSLPAPGAGLCLRHLIPASLRRVQGPAPCLEPIKRQVAEARDQCAGPSLAPRCGLKLSGGC